LVGVTRYCHWGAPETAVRIGGTKNPDLAVIRELGCDLVLANTEENRPADLEALRAEGLPVLETFPRSVRDVAPLLSCVAAAVSASSAEAARLAADVETAVGQAVASRPGRPLRALTLVWRRPWMALGTGTYAADHLLTTCGFTTVIQRDDRYPRIHPGDPELVDTDVILLPSEPYAFSDADVPALRDLGVEAPAVLVDGRLLTWHGPATTAALRYFSALAQQLSSCAPGRDSRRSQPPR